MKLARARVWCGILAVAVWGTLLASTPARAQQYVFHRASVDPQVPGNQFTNWDFEQVVKRNTAVADLAVSLIGYFTIGPVDTNRVKFVFKDAANQLNFSSQINVEFSGDTVSIAIPIDPDACDTSGFGFCAYNPATAPFSVTFRPNERGFYQDTLTFTFTYPLSQVVKLPIRGTGIGFLKLVNTSGQLVDTATYPLAATRVGDSLPGSGFPISVRNTSTNQLGKIEDVVMSDVAQFHVVNPQLEIQPGQTAILSIQFTPQSLGFNSGWGKLVSDDFAVDTALMNYTGTGQLGLDYFTNDDTTDINGNDIHVVIDELVTDTVVVGNKIDSLIWIQNKLNQNVELELVMHCGHSGFKLLSQFGQLLNESDTLFPSGGQVTYRDSTYQVGDTIRVGCDEIEVTGQTVVPIVLTRTLPLNDSMRVWVRFNPATRGLFSDSIETIFKPFIGSDALITGLFGLEGEAIGPGFGWARDSIDFGPLTPGLTLKDSVALDNPGQLTVDVSIDTTGLDPVFRLLTEADFAYASHTTFYAVFQYAAVDNAFHIDTVHVTSNDPNNPSLDLILTGGTQAPVVLTNPASLVFGDVVVGDTLSLSVYVKNIGLINLDVTNVTTTSAVFLASPTAFSVIPGDSQLVSVRFVPTAAVAYPDTLRITSNDPKKPIFKVPISAGGSNPVYFSTGSITFGATTLNAGSLVDSVGIRNNGTRGNMICRVYVSNGTYFSLAKASDTLIFIPAQTTYQLAIRFSQSVPAVVYDSVIVLTNDPATDTAYIELSGGGFFKQLSWQSGPLADTTLYQYGKVSVAVAETLTSVLTNLGNDTLKVTAVSLYSGAAGFKRVSPVSAELLQSEQFDVAVEFLPPGDGLFTDTLLILTNDTTAGNDSIVVPLLAQAYTPGLTALASSLVFDTTDIGSTTLDSVGFFNPGEAAVTISTVSMVLGSRFNVAGFPASVGADVTGFVRLAFTPNDTLVYSDTLRVTTTNPVATLKIPVSGTGAGGRYADNVDSLKFAPTAVFSTSMRSFTVTNVGNRPLSIDTIKSQSGSGDFQRLSPGALALGAGEQATVTIGFTPSASAAYQDTIVLFTSDQSNATVRIPVFGETPDRDINLSRNRLLTFPNPQLDIGPVKVATTGAKNLVVYNSGLDSLIVWTADLLLPNTAFGIVKGQWSDTLSARGTRDDSFVPPRVDSMVGAIRYAPLEKKAADTNWMIISSNDPDEDTIIVRIIASAVAGQLRVLTADSSAHFGTIKVGTLDTSAFVSVQNTFGNRVRLSHANFLSPPKPDFTIQAAIHRVGQTKVWSNFDPLNPPTIGRDSIISFRWIYAPSDTGTDADVFRVIGTPDNAGDTINIPVSGRGAAPVLAMAPTSLDFGTLKVSTPGSPAMSREILVTITNPGSDTLKIDTLRTVNAGAAHYNDTFVPGFTLFPWRVPPGAVRNFGIRVVVTERKVHYDTLRFINNDPLRDPFTFYARVIGTAPGDVGFVDTVRISNYEQEGAQIVVPLHLSHDEPIKRFSIPLHYKSSVFECVGLDFERTLLEGADGLVPEVDTVQNTIAIKGNLIFGPLIDSNDFVGTVFARMIFEARGTSSTDSSITFDTAFISPDIAYSFEDGQSQIILPEFVTQQLNVVTSVGEETLPVGFELEQNYPNPFNPQTTIAFSVPRPGHVTLVVYNLLGQRIRTVSEGFLSPGRYEFIWNGDDDRGQLVSSGIYFYHLAAEEFSETRKMVLMK